MMEDHMKNKQRRCIRRVNVALNETESRCIDVLKRHDINVTSFVRRILIERAAELEREGN
jgi:hypothetical protein